MDTKIARHEYDKVAIRLETIDAIANRGNHFFAIIPPLMRHADWDNVNELVELYHATLDGVESMKEAITLLAGDAAEELLKPAIHGMPIILDKNDGVPGGKLESRVNINNDFVHVTVYPETEPGTPQDDWERLQYTEMVRRALNDGATIDKNGWLKYPKGYDGRRAYVGYIGNSVYRGYFYNDDEWVDFRNKALKLEAG